MRTIDTVSSPSPALLRACAIFGLGVRRRAGARRSTPLAPALLRAIAHSRLTLVTGASGSGKSALGAAIARRLRARGRAVVSAALPRDVRRALIDSLPRRHALRSLAAAGLADATLLARPVGLLSEGERARLGLARAIAAASSRPARRRVTILADEFASTLDRATARGVCLTLARWARSAAAANRRVVCITAHDDVLEWLRPDALFFLGETPAVLERSAP